MPGHSQRVFLGGRQNEVPGYRQCRASNRVWAWGRDGGSGRGERFARLLERAGLRPPPGFPRWEDPLAGALVLFFEVNLSWRGDRAADEVDSASRFIGPSDCAYVLM
jgi:hypothetical protein